CAVITVNVPARLPYSTTTLTLCNLAGWFSPFSGITELVNNVLQPQQKSQNEKEPEPETVTETETETETKLHQQFESYKDQVKKMGDDTTPQTGTTGEPQKNPNDSPTCGICHKTKFADGCGHLWSITDANSSLSEWVTLTLSAASLDGLLERTCCFIAVSPPPHHHHHHPHCRHLTPSLLCVQVMWVCNLCRKQQEILTKSGAWFYSGTAGPRGVSEGPRGRRHEEAPQEKKAKLQQDLLYQGPPGDVSADRSRPPGLPRQGSLNNGSGLRHSGPGQDIDR
ncbi:unnamed protein product, partial [Coregonus sp. 'balchen']